MYRGVLSSGLTSHWRREVLRTSLWFVPAVEVLAAIALFIGTLTADRAAYRGDFTVPGWVISGSADAARQILTTIAAAIITVVGVVFSIILVTLTLASTQFGPRMLRNFIRDRGTQVTLGTFVGTFVYSVLVLVSIGTGSHGDFVPHIGVTVTLGLMVADLAVLIYFLHHIAIQIQLPHVIAGIAGDQQAAMFGQACFSPGSAKCTYGTGSFVLCNTGSSIVRSQAGLLPTVAWMDPAGALTYALEGSVFVTGAAVQWLRDGLGLLDNAAQSEALARSVPDTGGVVFVPALTGLGAPYWDPEARGAMFGLTRGTTRAHLVRAALEAITFEVRDVADLMAAEAPGQPGRDATLRVDGGASTNDLLMQLQADQLQVPVERPVVAETTGLGAAFLAGLAVDVWDSPAAVAGTWRAEAEFQPSASAADVAAGAAQWRRGVERSREWAR